MLRICGNLLKNKKCLNMEGKLTSFFSTQIKVAENKEIPVHLRPYDKEKFEVPSTKIKFATGYALLDVEPMPRAKIMKVCYNILQKV
jgi:hypothetical protein